MPLRLPEAPPKYDPADQDDVRRLIERALSKPASVGGGGGGGGGSLVVKRGDVNVAGAVATLDFAAPDFDVLESPLSEINVAIASGVARLGTIQTWGAQQNFAVLTASSLIIGTDPGGSGLLRAGGGFNLTAPLAPSAGVPNANVSTIAPAAATSTVIDLLRLGKLSTFTSYFRVRTGSGNGMYQLTWNAGVDNTGASYADDNTLPAWQMRGGPGADVIAFGRAPAGAGAQTFVESLVIGATAIRPGTPALAGLGDNATPWRKLWLSESANSITDLGSLITLRHGTSDDAIAFVHDGGTSASWEMGLGTGSGFDGIGWRNVTAGANRFNLWASGQIDVVTGPLIVGTDPGSSEILRVGGNINLPSGQYISFGGIANAYLQVEGTPRFVWSLSGTTRMRLETASLNPVAAAGLTLGTSALPWGSAFLGDTRIGRDTVTGSLFINGPAGSVRDIVFTTASSNRWVFRANSTAEGGSDAGSDFQLIARHDDGTQIDVPLTIARAASGLITTAAGRDLVVGTLGRFQSTVAPTTDQLLGFDASISKWVPRTVQLSFNSGVMVAANLGDGTAFTGANSNPSLSGAPSAPGAAPVVTPIYGGFIVDMTGTALPANTVYVLDYSRNGGAYTSGAIVVTSGKIVHQIVQNSAGVFPPTDTFAYKFKLRGASDSAYGPASSAASYSTKTEVNAFGLIAASQISTVNLAAIVADIGVITAGRIQNGANDAGIRVSSGYSLPSTWNTYLDLPGKVLVIKDAQGSPVTRVQVGKVGAGTTDYGLQVFDSAAATVMDFTGAKRILAVPVQPSVDSGSSLTIDLSTGLTQQVRLTATNATITLTNPTNGGRYRIWFQQDTTGSRAFPTIVGTGGEIVMFTNDTPPTLTTTPGALDLFEFEYRTSPTSRYSCMPLQTNVLLPTPTIVTTQGTDSLSATVHTIGLPASIVAGNLLLVVLTRTAGTITVEPSGFTRIAGTLGTNIVVYAKVAVGGETTVSITIDTTSDLAGTALQIKRWVGSLSGVAVSSLGASIGTAPDPPSLTAGWTDRTMWLAAVVAPGDPGSITNPANYSAGSSAGTAATQVKVAQRALYATTENPGTFTFTNSISWSTVTIAVQPPA